MCQLPCEVCRVHLFLGFGRLAQSWDLPSSNPFLADFLENIPRSRGAHNDLSWSLFGSPCCVCGGPFGRVGRSMIFDRRKFHRTGYVRSHSFPKCECECVCECGVWGVRCEVENVCD